MKSWCERMWAETQTTLKSQAHTAGNTDQAAMQTHGVDVSAHRLWCVYNLLNYWILLKPLGHAAWCATTNKQDSCPLWKVRKAHEGTQVAWHFRCTLWGEISAGKTSKRATQDSESFWGTSSRHNKSCDTILLPKISKNKKWNQKRNARSDSA